MTGADLRPFLGFSEFSSQTSPKEAADRCLRLGLSAFQLVGDFPINFPEFTPPAFRKEVKEYISQKGLRLHFHSPHDIPLATRHDRIRQGGIERMKEFVQLAIDMGASTFVIHPGRFAVYKMSTGSIVLDHKNIPQSYYDRFSNSFRSIVDFAAGRLSVLLENTHGFSDRLCQLIDEFLELDGVGLAWDIAYAAKGDAVNSGRAAEFISKRLAGVKLIHLHDYSRGRGHLALGTGELKIKSYIDIIAELKIDTILEVFSEADIVKSLDYIDSLFSRG